MLKLVLKEKLAVPLELSVLRADILSNCSSACKISELPVYYGNSNAEIGDFFDVTGDVDSNIVIEGDLSKAKRIGEGMEYGNITIYGNVGMHLGEKMKGGKIIVNGNVSDWMGSNMSGGIIVVNGNVGNFACSSYWGEKEGVNGGVIFIDGSVGDDLGRRMRRGTIFVTENSGDFTGGEVIAGTIFILGSVGKSLGAGMKRGSIILSKLPELLPSFYYSGKFKPLFLSVYFKYFEREFSFKVPKKLKKAVFERYMGDFLAVGKGEILVCLT